MQDIREVQMAVIGYIRVSTAQQDVRNQRLEILEYSRKENKRIDDFIEVEVSSRQSLKARRIEELLHRLSAGDTLIVTELSRLGRSTAEVIDLVNELIRSDIRLIAIKQGIRIGERMDMQTKVVVTMFALFADLERDVISDRTKQALMVKRSQGVRLGKPKGTIQKSRLDGRKDAIAELLQHQVSKAAIARIMGVSRTALTSYVESRGMV
jgi:putative DNA-invertase from lambdoid prophage Rac